MKDTEVLFFKTNEHSKLPVKGSTHAAAYDVYANLYDGVPTYTPHNNKHTAIIREKVDGTKYILINSGETVLISIGYKVVIPNGFEMEIVPRSGLSLKQKLFINNSPGTIDSDYRGIVMVMLTNLSSSTQEIQQEDRIAQFKIREVLNVIPIEPIHTIEEHFTDRGDGGFGHTGK